MRTRFALSFVLAMSLVLLLSMAATAAYTWTSTGSPSPGGAPVTCLTLDDTHDILYAGADTGEVYRYQGGSWSTTGGPSAQTRINDIEYDPVSNTLVAALYVNSSFEVWTFQEGGAWTLTNGAVGNDNPSSVASDGTRKKLYAGTYSSATWVYDYQSGPGPWASIGNPMDGLRCMEMDPAANVLYAGGSIGTEWPPTAAVYRYDGSGWTPFGLDFGTYAKGVTCLALDSTRNILYAGIYVGDQTGEVNVFRRNVAAGGDWVGIGTLCGGPEIYSLTADEVNDTLYALAWDGHVYKNCNASTGGTWIDLGLVSQTTDWNSSLQYDPAGATLFCGSSDGDVYRQQIPALTAIDPPAGALGETMDVELTAIGSSFTTASEVVFSGDGVNVNSTTRLSATKVRANVTIELDTYTGPRNVWVKTGGDKTNKLVDGFTVTEVPPLSTWYLAEGSNAWGFNTYITIENPNDEQMTARLTYMDPNPSSGTGIAGTRTVTLPPLSQTTVSSYPDIGEVDFSTKVECLDGKTIAVDRTMYWTGEGASSPEGHGSIGTTTPSTIWYLPEGSSAWGFETWTLVLNPNATQADVTLTYMTEAGPVPVSKAIPANSRATYDMTSDIGAADASIEVTSDVPVVAERSMYRNGEREGSCSIGATMPAVDYFLAEGTTAWGFTTYVLVQNPNDSDADVSLTYHTTSGSVPGPTFTMPANSRGTVKVNEALPATDFSTQVHGDLPLIAERAMYWDSGAGEAMHDSIGLDSAHMTFYLPDGQTSDGFETYTCVQNPNPMDVNVRITYLPQGGGPTVTFTDEIPLGSRKTYNMADQGINGRASILVESLDGARPIMVERAMYWNSRGAGTDTIGGYE
ncbi:MAG: hypothetical protein V1748_07125 [Actinomycetota bacterium]